MYVRLLLQKAFDYHFPSRIPGTNDGTKTKDTSYVRLSILETKLHGRSGIIKDAPRLLSVKSILLTKNRAWQPQDDATPSFVH